MEILKFVSCIITVYIGFIAVVNTARIIQERKGDATLFGILFSIAVTALLAMVGAL